MNTRHINSILGIGLALGLATGTTTARAENGIVAEGQRALGQIQAQATAPPSASERVHALQRSFVNARIIPGLEALRGQRQAALASIQAELRQDMLHGPVVVLHPGVRITRAVSSADTGRLPGDWTLPSFEIKPLIDPTVLFFSLDR